MDMASKSRPLLVTAMAIVAAVVAASVLLTMPRFLVGHVVKARVIKLAVNNQGIVNSPISLNIPIYVVGSLALVQRLVGVGVNQSLIRPVSLDELPELPSGSVVVIDWSLIKPSIVVGDTLGKVTINLTSPVIHDLATAIDRGDIVGVYANGSDEGVVEFVLAYSWALATKHRLIFNGRSLNDYLLAYPVIPVNIHEPVVMVVRWAKPWGLIIGPVYLNQLPTVIVNMIKPTTTVTTASSNADPDDPCYEEYSQLSGISNPAPGVYVASQYTFIWAAPMFYPAVYQNGIPGYSDGNGSYYWDTCLLASNEVFGIAPPSVPINVIGYEKYFESSTMYNNYGLEGYQVGAIDYYTGYQLYKDGIDNAFVGDVSGGEFSQNSWNPPPTSSTSSYEIYFGMEIVGQMVIPFLGFSISLPVGTSESISASQNPSYTTSLPNVPVIEVSNITWTFNIDASGNSVGFPNAFEDITPASVLLQSLSTTSIAAFLMDFENYATTSQVPYGSCYYYTDQTIWVNAEWYIVIVPQSSSTVSLTQSSLNLYLNSATTPPSSYVTGVSSSAQLICTPSP